MGYLYLCSGYCVDTETWQFQHMNKISGKKIDVPDIFWTKPFLSFAEPDKKRYRDINTWNRVDNIVLNGFEVETMLYTGHITSYFGAVDRHTLVSIHKPEAHVGVIVNPFIGLSTAKTGVLSGAGVGYEMSVNGREKRSATKFDDSFLLGGLYCRNQILNLQRTLWFGLTPHSFRVHYRDMLFEGACFVLFLGTFCVLLNDDLSFHSLATLKGADIDEIDVDQFIYTTSPFVTKLMLLGK